MRLALLVAIGVAMLSFGVGAPGIARACSIVPFQLERGPENADVIVFGRLVDADKLVATFDVEHSFGGEPLPPSLRIDNRYRTLGDDCSEPAQDSPRFAEGTYLAFLNRADDGQYLASWFGMGMVQVKGQELMPWWPHPEDEHPFTLPQSLDEAQAWLVANVGEAVPPQERATAEPGRSRAWFAVPVLLAAGALTAGFALRRVRRSGAR